MTLPALRIWKGCTVHARYTPIMRRFSYGIVLIDVDIDRLDEANAISPLFKVNAPGLFSFCTADHGNREKKAALRPWAEAMFETANVSLDGGAVRLITFPRHFFYKFAPLSLWYGYGPSGELRGIIYEVNNTFGETHAYVAPVSEDGGVHEADKAFHVSPFFDVSGNYRFRMRAPTDKLGLVVDNVLQGQRIHMASIKAREQAVSTQSLFQLAFTNPLSTIGVTVGIHWQALKIWLRKAGYRRKPPPPTSPVTVAKELPESASNKSMEAA